MSALALMVLALAAWWFGGDFFVLTWLAAAIAVLWEWQSMIGGLRKTLRLIMGSLALIMVAALSSRMNFGFAGFILVLASCGMAVIVGQGLRLWASAGLLYAGALIGSLCLLDADPLFGGRAILWLFAVVWGTDVFAYFGGRLIGGPKIWPRISPGKTWSGTLTGITCGAVLGMIVGVKDLATLPTMSAVFGLSFLTAAVAQIGDMFESWMKRQFGVKDSSHLIPGHGGFMDRLDGFIAAAFFAAVFGFIHTGGGAGAGLFVWR